MDALDTVFTNKKLRPDRLVAFGFSGRKGRHTYSVELLDGQFEMTVTVSGGGVVSAEVIDCASGEAYILHRIADARGPLVGKIRDEYEGVLAAIAEACYEPDVFKSELALRVIRRVREEYGDEPEFLWDKFPRNAIFRRQDNAKWYAALLTVNEEKLGLRGGKDIEILDLRMQPEEIPAVVDGKKYFPGYHMNKRHWITIRLDGSVPADEIFSRIDESFIIAAAR